ncbi:MAG: hypothetical protein PF450_09505 [Bacteroidales bacterium]|nr:hypothetical protein [Bacteroidales bacterium]
MDRFLKDLIEQNTPKMNSDVVDGLAVKFIPFSEEYIDSIFRSAFRNNKSNNTGIEYLSYERCSPIEEFNETTKSRNNKRFVDLGRSDIFMVKYFMNFRGNPLPPRYIYLPFVGEGGSISLGGSKFFVYPVLSNKIISVTQSGTQTGVFIRLLRDKINFERLTQTILVDGRRESGQVIWANVYRKAVNLKNPPATTKAVSTNIHYLLAKHGFDGLCERYLGFIPVAGDNKTITTQTHPPCDWVICESTGIKPKSVVGAYYIASDLRIAIPRDKWTNSVANIIFGLFYIADNFPDRIKYKYLNNTPLWSILLGHIIFTGHYSEGKLFENIKEHFNSLDEYVDDLVSVKLKEIGYDCQDFYELLFIIVENFSLWVTKTDSINTMYGKELSILYDTLNSIITDIFKTSFKIKKKVSMKPDVTEKEIIELLNRGIRTGSIFNLVKSSAAFKQNISSVSYSGDHKFFKVTSTIIPQESNRGSSSGGGRVSVNDSNNKLHPSYAEAGGYLAITKSQPIGHGKINPYVKLDSRGTIIKDPLKEDLINRTQQMLMGNLKV